MEFPTDFGLVSIPIEQRALRLGRRVEAGRFRPRRVEVWVYGRRTVLRMPRVPDPWVETALGVLVVWAASATILALARLLEERADGTARGDPGDRVDS